MSCLSPLCPGASFSCIIHSALSSCDVPVNPPGSSHRAQGAGFLFRFIPRRFFYYRYRFFFFASSLRVFRFKVQGNRRRRSLAHRERRAVVGRGITWLEGDNVIPTLRTPDTSTRLGHTHVTWGFASVSNDVSSNFASDILRCSASFRPHAARLLSEEHHSLPLPRYADRPVQLVRGRMSSIVDANRVKSSMFSVPPYRPTNPGVCNPSGLASLLLLEPRTPKLDPGVP